jgi:hypothetical protein
MDPQPAARAEAAPSQRSRAWLASWLLGKPLAILVGALCLLQLATWLPHYLTWPWYTDHDVFGTMAYAWHLGVLPYRDMLGNNFPGALYLCWLLGHLCGWGKTYSLFAADAFLLTLLGVSTLVWSSRRMDRLLPGLVGYGTFLGYYLSLDYSMVAQRDWHAAFFAVVALQVAESGPSRFGLLCSAAAMAMAVLFRPQAVLFGPALILAIDEVVRAEGVSLRPTVRAVSAWALAVAALVAIGFLPLVFAGVFPDFLNALRMFSPGGGYNRISPLTIARQMTNQLQTLKIALVPIAAWLLLGLTSQTSRRLARTWILAFLCVLFYNPLSPTPHAYLVHPLMLVWAMTNGVLVHVVLEVVGLAPALRITVVLLVMGLGLSLRPRYCNPRSSLDAIGYLKRGEDPGPCPMGYTFNIDMPAAAAYPWEDYRNLLAYLRQTDPAVRLANALKLVPAITGPTARLPAFPAESVAWLTVVRKDDEDLFVEALRRTPNSLVIWAPSEKGHPRLAKLSRFTALIEALYEPDRRFGVIEVWRRKREPEGPAAASTGGRAL